jgi:Helix-turn-helix domain
MESGSCAVHAAHAEGPRVGDAFVPWRRFHGFFVPQELARAAIVSPGAMLCWAALARHAGQDGDCYPREVTLAKELGRSERQVRRYVRQLESAGLIRISARGLNEPNRYEFLWHSCFDGATPLIPKDRTSMADPDRTHAACPDRTSTAGPHPIEESPSRESRQESFRSIEREHSSEAKTKTTPAPARWPWPAEDVEQLRAVIESYELRNGRHAVASDDLVAALLRKAVYYLTSPLGIAHVLEKKRVYVSHRPSCVPETERWFYRVVESHFAGLREVEAAASSAAPAAPRMPASSEMAPESAALVASVATRQKPW